MEDKTILKEYISRRRKPAKVETVNVAPVKVAWYQRPLEKGEFSYRVGKDNKKFYIQHNEWSKHIFVGPYDDTKVVNEIIDSYVMASLSNAIGKKLDKRVHSVRIDNPEEFFENG